MKKYCRGQYIEMTAEELAEMELDVYQVTETPTLEERLEAVESALLEQLLRGL